VVDGCAAGLVTLVVPVGSSVLPIFIGTD